MTVLGVVAVIKIMILLLEEEDKLKYRNKSKIKIQYLYSILNHITSKCNILNKDLNRHHIKVITVHMKTRSHLQIEICKKKGCKVCKEIVDIDRSL